MLAPRVVGVVVALWLCVGVCANDATAVPRKRRPSTNADSVRVVETLGLLRTGRLAAGDSAAHAYFAELVRGKHEDSLDVAGGLALLLEAAERQGRTRSEEFARWSERLVRLREDHGHPDALELADAWFYRGGALRAREDYDAALTYMKKSAALFERVKGPASLERAKVLGRMAVVHLRLGERDSARALTERVVAIRTRALGPDHRDVLTQIGMLAQMDLEAGDYASARARFRTVIEGFEKIEGPNSPRVAVNLINASTLSSRLGRLSEARQELERAVRILTDSVGTRRGETQTARTNLAIQYMDGGNPAGAERLYREVLATLDSMLTNYHTIRDASIAGLGVACARQGRFAEGDSLLELAARLQAEHFAREPWRAGPSLRSRADVQLALGNGPQALALCERAMDQDLREFGEEHPSVASDLVGRAEARLLLGDPAGAVGDAVRADQIALNHLRINSSTLLERAALDYAAIRARGGTIGLAAIASMPADTAMVAPVWDAQIRARGVVLNEIALRRIAVESSGDSIVAGLQHLSVVRHRELAQCFARGAEDSLEGFRQAMQVAQQACDSVDAALAEHSARFRSTRAGAEVGLVDVRRALPGGAALLAFVRGGSTADGIRTRTRSLGEQYFAFQLRPDGSVRALPLGRVAWIDSLVRDWRVAIDQRITHPGSASTRARLLRAGQDLRRAIWDPVSSGLEGATTIFIVPDGALSLVHLEALPTRAGRYVVESAAPLHVLSTERALIAASAPGDAHGLMAFGGPDFDRGEAPPTSLRAMDRRHALRSAPPDCDLLEHRGFAALSSAAREAEEVAALWKRARHDSSTPELRIGAAATEWAFKTSAPGREAIHLATHGFFLTDSCVGAIPGDDAMETPSPLLRSGLVLAGANRRDLPSEQEDGILTSEEIASMDLSGTRLVTLSACDTGVGTVVSGEGVFGLRRAFELAGASGLVMSLWKVRESDARDWMRAFYEAHLAASHDVPAAARLATLKLLRRKRAEGHDDPTGWAAFVTSGAWR